MDLPLGPDGQRRLYSGPGFRGRGTVPQASVEGVHIRDGQHSIAYRMNHERLVEDILSRPPGDPVPPLPPPSYAVRVPVPLSELLKRTKGPQEVPQDVIDAGTNPKPTFKLAQRFFALAAEHPDGLEGHIAETQKEMDEWVATVQSRESTKRQQARKRMSRAYHFMMNQHCPRIPPNEVWHADVVLEWAPKFLKFLVVNTAPLPGRKVVKARTLIGWFSLFVHAIVRHCRDSGTGDACGMVVMTRMNLFEKLSDVVARLTRDFNLDRTYDRRLYFGRAEIHLMLNKALDDTAGRHPNIQGMLKLLFPFYTSCRPSTLGPSCKEYLEAGLGHNKEQAKEQIFNFETVMKGHNMIFDVVTYVIADLFLRGAFLTKYKTTAELVADRRAELPLDPALAEEPFFLAIEPGGRDFKSPKSPARAESVSACVAKFAKLAGLPIGGGYCIRRDAGNEYLVDAQTKYSGLMGQETAVLFMAHEIKGTFMEHYSRGTADLNPVHLRLGEIDGTLASARDIEKRHLFSSCAIEAIVRFSRQEESGIDPEVIKEAEKQRCYIIVEATPEMMALEQKRVELWSGYVDCFTESAKTYSQDLTNNISFLYDLATGKKLNQKEEIPPLRIKPGKETLAVEKRDELMEFTTNDVFKTRKRLRKNYRAQAANAASHALKHGTLSGTDQDRYDAINRADELSKHISGLKITPLGSAASRDMWVADIEDRNNNLLHHFEDTEDLELDSEIITTIQNFTGRGKDRMQDPTPVETPAEQTLLAEEEEFYVAANELSAAATESPIDAETIEYDFLQAPVEDIRYAFLNFLVGPVLAERQLKLDELPNGQWNCHRCELYRHYDPIPTTLLPSLGALKRHIPWADLELQMVGAEGNGDSVVQVRGHVVSENCVAEKQHLAMLTAHHSAIARLHNYEQGPRHNVHSRRARTDDNGGDDDDEAEATTSKQRTKKARKAGTYEDDISRVEHFFSSASEVVALAVLPDFPMLQEYIPKIKEAGRPGEFGTDAYEKLGDYSAEEEDEDEDELLQTIGMN
ncbi:hypothetical protein DXG01_005435 [Tephrocybe rancida]|nr:hypothetical protein DXG01_005435 [Tephrocybe rancida]